MCSDFELDFTESTADFGMWTTAFAGCDSVKLLSGVGENPAQEELTGSRT
jgi:hypothetical protein